MNFFVSVSSLTEQQRQSIASQLQDIEAFLGVVLDVERKATVGKKLVKALTPLAAEMQNYILHNKVPVAEVVGYEMLYKCYRFIIKAAQDKTIVDASEIKPILLKLSRLSGKTLKTV